MPYTAPSKQSPSAQHIECSQPIPSGSPKVPQAPSRPHLPRSYSSTSYVRKHRRSPSGNKSLVLPAVESSSLLRNAVDPHASLRQSPPPFAGTPIPAGAVLSPPDSSPPTSDEDSTDQEGFGVQLEELEAAVRSMDREQASSPEKAATLRLTSTNMDSGSNSDSSDSSTPREGQESQGSPSTEFTSAQCPEDPFTSSPEESGDDQRKPPMIRKKSGELVRPALRPASARRRPSSMPGTPTFAKVVHFDSQLEQVRHFLQVDKPVAVSAETSPVDDHENDTEFPWGIKPSGEPISDWKLRLVNFPQSQSSQKPVRLENLSLSTSQTNLVGIVAVANLAFQKQVAARFTFDRWETVSEVVAEYSHEAQSRVPDGYDRFSFSIKLADQANLESKTLLACIRYSVSGREYWDNNSSMNYQVAFDKAPKAEKHGSRLASRPALPKSRSFRGSHKFRPHSMSSFDDFSGMGNYLSFPRPVSLPQDDSDGIEPITLARRDKQSRQAFGNRYDFGASLSATVRTQPTDDRTTVTARAKAAKETDETKVKLVVDRAEPVCESNHETAQSEPPQRSFAGKPHHDSTVYKELVDKYCFYGSPRASTHARRPTPSQSENPKVSEVESPPSPNLPPQPTQPRSQSTSPGPSIRLQYHHSMHRFLKEAQTPAPIKG